LGSQETEVFDRVLKRHCGIGGGIGELMKSRRLVARCEEVGRWKRCEG